MKISLVIPVYNEEKYLQACLDSIMQQEVMPDEIIIVNNNSTDNTLNIAKKYPVKIIHEKTQGITPTRNKGFNQAQFDVIARTDADSIVPKDWIKKIKTHFEKDQLLMGLSGRAYFLSGALKKNAPYYPPKAFLQTAKKLFKHDFMFGPNMALKKTAWEKIKNDICLDDTEVHEDIDLAIHLAKVGKIKFDSKLGVHSSARRAKKLASYVEYPYRYITMIRNHKKMPKLPSRKKFVKAMHPRRLLKKSIDLLSA
jgi:glycosyltransferase involved in cell wall biosynthesis